MLGLERKNIKKSQYKGVGNQKSDKSLLSVGSSSSAANKALFDHQKHPIDRAASTTFNSKRSKSFYLTNI